jgi:hypothetical protein
MTIIDQAYDKFIRGKKENEGTHNEKG